MRIPQPVSNRYDGNSGKEKKADRKYLFWQNNNPFTWRLTPNSGFYEKKINEKNRINNS